MLADYVLETTSAPGTTQTIALGGSVTDRRSFASAFSNDQIVFYCMDDGTQAEVGIGQFISGNPNQFTRQTVLDTTSGGTSRLNFSGSTRIFSMLPAGHALFLDQNGAVNCVGGAALTFAAPITVSTVIANGLDASGNGGQFRAIGGEYGAFIRNDGANVYFLQTAQNAPTGAFNAYRPFAWNLSNGSVEIDLTNAGCTIGGYAAVKADGTTYSINISGSATKIINGSGGSLTVSGSAACALNQNLGTGDSPTFNGLTTSNGQVNGVAIGGNAVGNSSGGQYGAWSPNHFSINWVSPSAGLIIDGTQVGQLEYVASDYRLKHSVKPYKGNAQKALARLRPVSFRYRSIGPFKDDRRRRLGFIAHELAEVVPSAVDGKKDGKEWQSLKAMPVIALMVAAMQEDQAEKAALKAQLAGALRRIAALESR